MDGILKKIDKRISDNYRFLNDTKRPIPNNEKVLLKLEIAFMKEIKTDIEKLINVL
jgi:hypothetical protein